MIKTFQINRSNKYFGYVPQNVYLSDDSIAKNIALGVEENLIDMDKVKKCAQKTGENFINNLIMDIVQKLVS